MSPLRALRRWSDHGRTTIEVSPEEVDALIAVRWAELTAAVDRGWDAVALRSITRRWEQIVACADNQVALVPGLLRAIGSYIEEQRRHPHCSECAGRASVLSALVSRLVAAAETELEPLRSSLSADVEQRGVGLGVLETWRKHGR